MDAFFDSHFKKLLSDKGSPRLSVYISTHREGGFDIQEDPVRLKNALDGAEAELHGWGLSRDDATRVVDSARAAVPFDFDWHDRGDGLALFSSLHSTAVYKLPISFDDIRMIADEYVLDPLLPLVSADGHFFLLALSPNETRFFHCRRTSMEEMSFPDLPASLAEALKQEGGGPELDFLINAASVRQEELARLLQGPDKTYNHDLVFHYYRRINTRLQNLLREEKAPMVVAGADYLTPIFEEVNTYPYYVQAPLWLDSKGVNLEELRDRAWAVLEPGFLATRRQAAEKFDWLNGSGHASDDIRAVVTAALYGAVDTLFLTGDAVLWGRFNAPSGEVIVDDEPRPTSRNLYGMAAAQTVLHGGSIYVVPPEEMPEGRLAAAVYRYVPSMHV